MKENSQNNYSRIKNKFYPPKDALQILRDDFLREVYSVRTKLHQYRKLLEIQGGSNYEKIARDLAGTFPETRCEIIQLFPEN